MPIDILGLFYQICKDFGVNGVLIAVVIYLLIRLATNHLHHIGMDVKSCITKIDTMSTKNDESQKETTKKFTVLTEKVEAIGERTSKIEGKLGI